MWAVDAEYTDRDRIVTVNHLLGVLRIGIIKGLPPGRVEMPECFRSIRFDVKGLHLPRQKSQVRPGHFKTVVLIQPWRVGCIPPVNEAVVGTEAPVVVVVTPFGAVP